MKVFLSSTFLDLQNHRKLAIEALARLDQQVGHMEIFGARSEEPTNACLSEIEQCDIFIGIYAHRYGYVLPSKNISITEMEYDHAVKTKKSIFCFFIDDDHPWAPKMIDENPSKVKLSDLKKRIQEELVIDRFTSPDTLAFKISSSIGRYLTKLHLSRESSSINEINKSKIYLERVLKLRVHQAYFNSSFMPYYFINATNLSPNRALEITHIWYEDERNNIPVMNQSRILPVRLQVDESWETWIAIGEIPETYRLNAFDLFKARISTGDVFSSEANPNVPPQGFVPGGPVFKI